MQHFHKCYNFWKVNNQIIQQAFDLLSISDKYTAQHSSSLWSSINFRALSSTEFIKPLTLYQFHSPIKTIIQQASDLISTLDQYRSHNSPSLLSSINFRALSRSSFSKHLIFYTFQSNILKDIYTILSQTPPHFWSVLFKTRSHRSSV